MAEQQGPAAAFPTPPPFYKHFSRDNIARLRQHRKDAGIAEPPTESIHNGESRQNHVLSLPNELRYLIPPEPPQDGRLSAFGQEVSLNPTDVTLVDSQIEQLYPSHPSVRLNPQPHLIALARSMLTSFLSLTGILSQNPELYQETAQDLQTIVFNMHDLINQYRPHQARESLILMMEDRLAEMKDEIKRIDDSKEKVGKLLRDLHDNGTAQALEEADEAHIEKNEHEARAAKTRARQRAAWATLESEMG